MLKNSGTEGGVLTPFKRDFQLMKEISSNLARLQELQAERKQKSQEEKNVKSTGTIASPPVSTVLVPKEQSTTSISNLKGSKHNNRRPK